VKSRQRKKDKAKLFLKKLRNPEDSNISKNFLCSSSQDATKKKSKHIKMQYQKRSNKIIIKLSGVQLDY
jgi:hypothetical protein